MGSRTDIAADSRRPALVIHGGAGRMEGRHVRLDACRRSLAEVMAVAWPLLDVEGARAAVTAAVRRLEDDPLFNAGLGSKLQRDGAVRMSAALMDGRRRRFSGVVNIERVQHPIDVALLLQYEEHRVLAGRHALAFARGNDIPDFDPETEHRRREHEERRRGNTGTVGAVAVDGEGAIWAATSTGGTGFETPGRVSDSATVAGTFATSAAAVSCTGVGEDIVDHAFAARLVAAVDGGARLADAAERLCKEARDRDIGYIAVGARGDVAMGGTPGVTTLYLARTPDGDEAFPAT